MRTGIKERMIRIVLTDGKQGNITAGLGHDVKHLDWQ